ncbi:MAG: winged helix-turn-helix domain-containing protein [Nocardioidaceae bacterium]
MLREWSSMPVIVLSARQDSTDKVEALDVGADDYVTKPFGMDELMARVRAAVRRSALGGPRGGDLDLPDRPLRKARVARRQRGAPDSHRVGLLGALVNRPGQLVSQRQVLHEVWGPNYGSETNYLRVYMANLRRKLEPDPHAQGTSSPNREWATDSSPDEPPVRAHLRLSSATASTSADLLCGCDLARCERSAAP